jgi:predicted nucleic acid-binding protein
MGQLTVPTSGTVYVDTNTVIYHLERIEPYYTAAKPLWLALDQGRVPVMTSELALLEVLVKPLRDGRTDLATLYRNVLLATSGLTCAPITRAILEMAASLRATRNLKTPDAIHAATSLGASCVLFVTNDVGFRRVNGLNLAALSEVAAS